MGNEEVSVDISNPSSGVISRESLNGSVDMGQQTIGICNCLLLDEPLHFTKHMLGSIEVWGVWAKEEKLVAMLVATGRNGICFVEASIVKDNSAVMIEGGKEFVF